MKRLMLATAVGTGILFANLSMEKIESIVQKIQNKRVGKQTVDFAKTPSPFVLVVQAPEQEGGERTVTLKKIQNAHFQLSAIINGRANLNGQWVRNGDIVEGYTVEKVAPGEVFLSKGSKKVHLFLPAKSERSLLQISGGTQ